MLDVIKSYLVSLGYHVDVPSFQNAKGTMGEMEKVVSKFSDSSVLKFAAAGAAVTGFVSAAVAALKQFTIGVANADLQNEMFARRMWMSKDAAVSYKSSLEALGVSLQDLYLSPELLDKFIQLRKQASTMAPPGGFSEAMKGIRSITFEWQRLKLEASYATQWVSYYLTKYISEPLFGIKGGLKGINDSITANMPKWTKNAAQFLAMLARIGNAAYLTGKKIYDVWNNLDGSTKKIIGTLAALRILLWSLSFTPITVGLTALLLLIDDFATYERGGKSAFPKLWEWVDKLNQSMDDTGTLKDFKKSISELSDSAMELLNNLGKLFGLISGNEKINAIKIITSTFQGLADVLHIIASDLMVINGLMEGDKDKTSKGWNEAKKGVLKLFFGDKENFKDKFGYYPNVDDEKPDNQNKSLSPFELFKKDPLSFKAQTETAPKDVTDQSGEKSPWRKFWDEVEEYKQRSSNKSSTFGMQLSSYSKPENNEPKKDNYNYRLLSEFKQFFSTALVGLKQSIAQPNNNLGQFVAFAGAGGSQYSTVNHFNNYYNPISPVKRPGNVTISNEIKPTYHIYGANQPENVAVAVNRSNTGLLMRAQQGVIV